MYILTYTYTQATRTCTHMYTHIGDNIMIAYIAVVYVHTYTNVHTDWQIDYLKNIK